MTSRLFRYLWIPLLSALLALGGCAQKEQATTTASPAERTPVVVASTTSTEDSGLFDVLLPAFHEAYPQYELKIVAVGTGEALKLGEMKDADVLLVHAKTDEEKFVADGFGTERRDVMYNDFVILGPASDPARVMGSADTTSVMVTIAASKATFVSRGDDSGTHNREKKLWEAASVEPTGSWYLSVGQGMGETLKIASEKQAYTIADRATYLSMKDALDLEVLVENAKSLLNQYGVIPVAGAANAEGAKAFADWITSPEGQAVIGEFGVEKFGQPLFTPNAK